MKLLFSEQAWADDLYWQRNDAVLLKRVNDVIKDTLRSPFRGIGKPEPLVGPLTGWWSRRLSREHRLVYRMRDTGADHVLEIASCRFHYR